MISQQPSGDLVGQIRTSILSGRYLPNERLIEAEIAEIYKTTRTNVRSALSRLEHERLVVHEPNRGVRVRLVSPDEAIEIVEVRGALEMLNAKKAAIHATSADKESLHQLLSKMRSAVRDRDYSSTVRLNNELHETIASISSNNTIGRFIDLLLYPIVRMQYRSILLPGRPEAALAEHEDVITAIVAGNAKAAMAAMEKHFDGLLDALKRSIEISDADVVKVAKAPRG